MTGTNSFQLNKTENSLVFLFLYWFSKQFFLESLCLFIFDFDQSNYFATGKTNLSKKKYFFSGKILLKNHAIYWCKKYFRENFQKSIKWGGNFSYQSEPGVVETVGAWELILLIYNQTFP